MCKTAEKDQKLIFKTDFRLMQVKRIVECSKGNHSAIRSTFIKLRVPFLIKIFILSIFEWPFTVLCACKRVWMGYND